MANSLYISYGNRTDSPVAPKAHGPTGGVNGKVLVVGRLTTHAAGSDTLEVSVFKPGTSVPADPAAIVWDTTYAVDENLLATHLLIWMNGDYPFEMDAIRVATTYAEAMFQPVARHRPGRHPRHHRLRRGAADAHGGRPGRCSHEL